MSTSPELKESRDKLDSLADRHIPKAIYGLVGVNLNSYVDTEMQIMEECDIPISRDDLSVIIRKMHGERD
uniref:DUF1128 domain-containing protein n=1 Tax=Rhabditophanes sp. KR3021 TaxID=114890 RepID=A0AC35U2B5_9BILA